MARKASSTPSSSKDSTATIGNALDNPITFALLRLCLLSNGDTDLIG